MFTVLARLLVQLNSGVNPIVYATTIPEFKKTAHKLLNKYKKNQSFGEETGTQLTKTDINSSQI